MRIETYSYSIKKSLYIRYCFLFNVKNQWYVTLLFGLLFGCGVYFRMRWMFILALVLEAIYLLFWISTAYFFSSMPLGKKLFGKYSYVFSDNEVFIYIDAKHFHLIYWKDFLKIKQLDNGFVFFLSRLQFFYIPKNLFKSDAAYSLLCLFLKNKGLIS